MSEIVSGWQKVSVGIYHPFSGDHVELKVPGPTLVSHTCGSKTFFYQPLGSPNATQSGN
jgi:hypothetical protein